MASLRQVEDIFSRELEKRVLERMTKISVGNLASFDQYRFECGILKGLQEAIELLEEAIKKANDPEGK